MFECLGKVKAKIGNDQETSPPAKETNNADNRRWYNNYHDIINYYR